MMENRPNDAKANRASCYPYTDLFHKTMVSGALGDLERIGGSRERGGLMVAKVLEWRAASEL